jgi:hypothetical protein
MPARRRARVPLTAQEKKGIITAVDSAFMRLRNLYKAIVPTFQRYGFTPPSAGVIARDLSEKIEASIVQHCESFTTGEGHCDLCRAGVDWEVKICKHAGLTINQSKVIKGENYIVVNYRANTDVVRIFVLWEAQDGFFSPKIGNSNARRLNGEAAKDNIEVIYELKATDKL